MPEKTKNNEKKECNFGWESHLLRTNKQNCELTSCLNMLCKIPLCSTSGEVEVLA